MKRMSVEDEVKHLKKQNRIIKRQIGQLKKDVKVDVKKLQADCYQEGYETGRDQVLSYIERMGNWWVELYWVMWSARKPT